MNRTERLTRDVLLYGLVPTWVAAGVVDWWCHRRTRIEENAGLPESLSHVAMLAQAGVPTTLGLFLEVDPPLLALTYLATAAHTATAYWDVAYAAPCREISPTEQHVHAFLEVLPMTAAAFLTVLHPGQTEELFRGKGWRWRLRLKRHALSPGYIAGLLSTLCLALGFPVEEVVRCARAALRRRADRRVSPAPTPPAPELATAGAQGTAESTTPGTAPSEWIPPSPGAAPRVRSDDRSPDVPHGGETD